MIDMTLDTTDAAKALDALAKKVSTSVIRAGCAESARLLYAEAKLLAPVSDGSHVFHGTHSKYVFAAGTLRDSIYRAYSKDNSGDNHVTYHVAWNHRKAPYGFMVEFGTSRAPAHPFLGTAYANVAKDAIASGFAAMQREMATV